MNAAVPQAQTPDEQPLLEQIGTAQQKLGGLEEHLSTIAGELEELALQAEQHALLEQTCGTLDRLNELGALNLFFGDDAAGAASHLERVRARIADFRARVAEAEGRRHAVAGQIASERDVLDLLEYDLEAIRAEEEERRNEWVIEREVGPERERIVAMPWVGGAEDDRRLRKNLLSALAAACVFGAVFPMIDIPLPDVQDIIEVPERLVELIRERRPLPPPQQAAEQRREERPQEQEPTEEPVEQPQEQVAAVDQPPAETPPGENIPDAEPGVRARQSGILAFRESFSTLAARPAAALGSDARISRGGDAAVGRPERAMVTTLAPGSSGGINLSSLSRGLGGSGDGGGTGGAMLAGVTTTRVGDAIGGSGGGGGRPLAGSSGVAGRTDEEIQIVFDRYKAALYRLYNRELRNIPTLRGQMVLKLTIEPSGAVSFLELVSSELDSPTLAAQVLERVRTFDFGAKDVAPITIVYPIDFLPAA